MMRASLKSKILLAASFAALAFFGQACQTAPEKPQTGKGAPAVTELYLTLPFCVDKAVEANLELRAAELREAVEAERKDGQCLEDVRSINASTRASNASELERVDGYLEFALACSAKPEDSEEAFRNLAAGRIAAETAALYCRAASIQKALEDSASMLKKEESDALHKDYDDARLELVRFMNYKPVTEIRLDSASLDELAAAKPDLNEPPEGPELSVVSDDGRKATLKLSDEFKGQLNFAFGPGILGSKRLWMVAGCKAAKTLLSPKSSADDKALYRALAKTARERLAQAKLRDAWEAFEKTDAALRDESAKQPGPELASAIVKRDLALAVFCIALEARRNIDGSDALTKHAPAGLPAPKDEPPDPTLVEGVDPAGPVIVK